MKFTATMELSDVPFEIEINYYPGEQDTRWEPGYPDDCEVDSISFGGIMFTDEQEFLFIKSYGEQEFQDWMMQQSGDEIINLREMQADYKYETMINEKVNES